MGLKKNPKLRDISGLREARRGMYIQTEDKNRSPISASQQAHLANLYKLKSNRAQVSPTHDDGSHQIIIIVGEANRRVGSK